MIIQLPEWEKWRIAGSEHDWQVQKLRNRKNAEPTWEGERFYPSLDYAINYAYEKTLRENGITATDFETAIKECERVKKSLIAAVRKAVE